ncbi:hypothetical protein B7C42_00986 [Nocardia cerradoensis]|uniref:Lipoprotein n=1 Tax=Nocardia cerradoensis TaxID=85688 RepID=A0A231HAP6_9NOCA|nr:hypothetical protein [Nocardia cerradoensis]OXR46023.1 hypothetical protein B7C42_00986 [Nocardia cerradoensis]
MKKFVVAALSSAALAVTLTACAHDEKTCCAPPASSVTPTPVPSDDGSGLRRNTSPSPAPPSGESARPHITLPHLTWPKRDPGAGGE